MPIRNVKVKDKHRILKLARHCAPLVRVSVLGTYEFLARCFSNTFFIYEEGGEIIGFIVGFPNTAEVSEFWIYQIGINEDHRGQGIGSKLLSKLITQVKSEDYRYIRSHYQFGNEHSHNLHSKFGFKICGQDENGYFTELIFSE